MALGRQPQAELLPCDFFAPAAVHAIHHRQLNHHGVKLGLPMVCSRGHGLLFLRWRRCLCGGLLGLEQRFGVGGKFGKVLLELLQLLRQLGRSGMRRGCRLRRRFGLNPGIELPDLPVRLAQLLLKVSHFRCLLQQALDFAALEAIQHHGVIFQVVAALLTFRHLGTFRLMIAGFGLVGPLFGAGRRIRRCACLGRSLHRIGRWCGGCRGWLAAGLGKALLKRCIFCLLVFYAHASCTPFHDSPSALVGGGLLLYWGWLRFSQRQQLFPCCNAAPLARSGHSIQRRAIVLLAQLRHLLGGQRLDGVPSG